MADDKKLTPRSTREQNLNSVAETETELQSQLITPQNGRAKISSDVKQEYVVKILKGNKYEEQSNWEMQSLITADTRLSNLRKEQEPLIQWCLEMQGDCVMLGLPESGAYADWIRLSVCEPSLGVGMALRNNIQTIRTKNENVSIEEKPVKRNILGIPIGGD